MTGSSRHRVFIGLNEVAGYYQNLATGFREIGVECRIVNEQPHPFEYGQSAPYARIAAAGARYRRALRSARPRSLAWIALLPRVAINAGVHVVIRLCLLVWVLARYDVIVFAGGTSFLRGRDFPVLRAFGKTIVCVFNGSDHRPPYLNRKLARDAERDGFAGLVDTTAAVRRHVRRVEQFASTVVALSASAQFHSSPYVEFLEIGIPFVATQSAPANASTGDGRDEADRPCRILHSPSDPEAKGTETIRSIVAALISMGHRIELIEVIDRPHHEVISAIRACDFVVDEVYSDTPMAGLATEAAYFGKPTVGSGYYASYVATELRPETIPPSVYCLPDELSAWVERLVVDHALRADLGERARAFVTQRWSPAAVADRFMQLIDGRTREDWIRDPYDLTYYQGWGMSTAVLGEVIAGMLAAGGEQSLGLSDKPELESTLVAMGTA